ncbi:peptide chain release factor 1 [Natronogracilivirga saccharolytica]|uniref:Peptide chain release factor 1 n=1 Tax=Natronogracilivirga saccharolytica TaxID=2812953 RepID=A0A8J7RN73_9BACT|nr:peptide chain release factor 1 [Natronogracilivirga saccharolytica]
MEKKLEQLKSRYEELAVALSDPGIYDQPEKLTEVTKEHSSLKSLVEDFEKWKNLKNQIRGNEEVIAQNEDPELTEMARMELKELKQELESLEEKIRMDLIPKDPEDSKNAIMEIRAGTGGDEAAIFAGDLFEMYRRYADERKWKIELMDLHESEKGGYKDIVFKLTGQDVFAEMKYESGVHRVQRVPETESQGRVHTSAATVAVLPEAEEVDVKINPADLEFEAYRASGAGGQHVNTTDSAVRIRHVPSGVVVTCQQERSQHKNREKAMAMLRSKLYEHELKKTHSERAEARKSQVSTGDRSAKIRTYNFPQGRLTDHRIGLTLYNLDAIMKGNLGEVIKALRIQDNLERMEQVS